MRKKISPIFQKYSDLESDDFKKLSHLDLSKIHKDLIRSINILVSRKEKLNSLDDIYVNDKETLSDEQKSYINNILDVRDEFSAGFIENNIIYQNKIVDFYEVDIKSFYTIIIKILHMYGLIDYMNIKTIDFVLEQKNNINLPITRFAANYFYATLKVDDRFLVSSFGNKIMENLYNKYKKDIIYIDTDTLYLINKFDRNHWMTDPITKTKKLKELTLNTNNVIDILKEDTFNLFYFGLSEPKNGIFIDKKKYIIFNDDNYIAKGIYKL